MARNAPLEPGERDFSVRLEQRPTADAVDAGHTPVDGPWTTLVGSMPAARYPITGRERLIAEQMASSYDTRWEINYRRDMDPDLVNVPKCRRIVYLGRTFDIVSANLLGRREGIALFTLTAGG